MKRLSLIWIVIAFIQPLFAQDVEKSISDLRHRWTENPVMAGGSVGLNTNYYAAGHSGNIGIPFSYNVFGSVNIDILGIQAPLSIFYTNKNTTFNLPSYRFIGISPEFRGHKLHLFDRTMDFSQYSFSGTAFTGVGYEGTFGKFFVKGMYGRLSKATVRDANVLNSLDNSFRRYGWGIGGGYKDDKQQYGIHLFQARDVPSSLTSEQQAGINPQAGSILVINGERKLGILNLKAEYAYNILTKNLNNDLPFSGRSLFSVVPGWHPANSSTGQFNAFKSELNLKAGKANIGLGYERIDPGYVSLGTLYFNNDIEIISLSAQTPLFKNRVQTQVRVGRQRNNLRRDQTNDASRLAVSGNINARLSRTMNLGVNFSNFSFNQKSYITVRPVIELDTLVLTQNNLNTGISLLKQFAGDNPGVMQFLVSYNDARTYQGDTLNVNARLRMLTMSAGFSKRYKESGWNAFAGINYNRVLAAFGNSDMYGPSVVVSKPFFGKFWESSFSISWLLDSREGGNRQIFRNFWSNKLNFSENATMDIRLMYSQVFNKIGANTSEFMFQTAIQYRFEKIALIRSFIPKSQKQSGHE